MTTTQEAETTQQQQQPTLQDEFKYIEARIPGFATPLINAIQIGNINGCGYTRCAYAQFCSSYDETMDSARRIFYKLKEQWPSFEYRHTPMEVLVMEVHRYETHEDNEELATLYNELLTYRTTLPAVYSDQATHAAQEETTAHAE